MSPEKLEDAGEVGSNRVSRQGDPMSLERLPPPRPAQCLIGVRSSRCKGGTIVAEDVWTVDEHRRRVCDPDGYRPCFCPRCEHPRLHVHDYVERKPVGLATVVVLTLVRYVCTACGAVWRVLPAFLPRHLWWTWRRVEAATAPEPAETQDEADDAQVRPVPPTTRRRWLDRLGASARQLVVLLASRGVRAVSAVAGAVGPQATRAGLVEAYAGQFDVPLGLRLGAVAALVHRLQRGVRLM